MAGRLRLGNDSFTIIRAQLVENPRDGSLNRDWDNAEEIVIEGAQVQPFRLAEKLNFEIQKEREFARTAIRFFAPPGTVVLSTDRIRYRGEIYEVFGHDGNWTDFRGREDHVAFIARRQEG